jgi:DNA-3-methyladenine glycosylase II
MQFPADHSKALKHLKRSEDPQMKQLVTRLPACTMGRNTNEQSLLWALIRAIVYQRISLKAAATVHQRFLDFYGQPDPTAEAIVNTPYQALRDLGLPPAKVASIQDAAEHVLRGLPDWGELETWSDVAIIDRLTQIRGIGQWSVEMLLMFQLQRWDVLPVGDLGLQMGMRDVYDLGELPKKKAMLALAQPWRPYRSIATWYLWQSRDAANQALLDSWS